LLHGQKVSKRINQLPKLKECLIKYLKFGTVHLLSRLFTTPFDKVRTKELLKLFGKYKMKGFNETNISAAYGDERSDLLVKSNYAQVLIGFETSKANRFKGIDRNTGNLRLWR